MRNVSTIPKLVDALGGPSALGALLGITQEAVSNWTARGFIPTGWHLRLSLLARRRGIAIDPAVFGLDDHDERYEFMTAFGSNQPRAAAG